MGRKSSVIAAGLLAVGLTGCAQIVAQEATKTAKARGEACTRAAAESLDGRLLASRMWTFGANDTPDKLTDSRPLTPEERAAMVRLHTQTMPCRQIVLDYDYRYAAWEAPYWQDLYARIDAIHTKLIAGEITVGMANRLTIESVDKFHSDTSRGQAQANRENQIAQQRASEAMLRAGAAILANQPRPQTSTTNCMWLGNTLNCNTLSGSVPVSPAAIWNAVAPGRRRGHNRRMPRKHPKRPRDLNQWAKHMVDLATGAAVEPNLDAGKDKAAVELGRRGGLKGGKARAQKMTAKARSESARKAAAARWSKKR